MAQLAQLLTQTVAGNMEAGSEPIPELFEKLGFFKQIAYIVAAILACDCTLTQA